ncbi:MAG: prolyl oligopeptidase family serine peptidase [Nitriliruptorales bacterium]|nr:prolyl oligopeptidase family serine peptidase [Nitriliruptorales bacterium]
MIAPSQAETQRPTAAPAWIRRFRAARVRLPSWGLDTPQRAVYATNATGVWQLMSWDLDNDRHTPLTDKPTGVAGGRVLPDGSGVTWFDDHDGDEVGRWVVTPFGGGEPAPLVADLGEGWSAGLSLRGQQLAIGIAGRDGFRIHTGTREATRQVYEHRKPAAVGGLSRDGRLLAISHHEHGDVLHPALKIVRAQDGEVVAELWDGAGNSVMPSGWSRVPGDERIAILADRSGRTRPQIWTPSTGERTPLTLDLPGEVWVADWEPDGAGLLLAHDHLGRTELYRYDLVTHRAERLDLPEGTVAGASIRDDGALWYAFTSSVAAPRIRIREVRGDRALLEPPGDPAPDGRAYTSLHYGNGEGEQVHAFLATPDPAIFGPPPYPLVVEAHGGPTAAAEDTWDPYTQAWVDHGFAVLLANYRGSTGYGKRWQDALEGDPGRPELIDLRAGRDHLVAEGVADAARIVLEGASWGGYLTLQGLGTQPESWSLGVAFLPVADYLSAFADESPELQEFDASLFGGTPEELPELYRERSPITYVAQVRAPVLIVTGRNDTRCPLRQVENYVSALNAQGKTVTLDVFKAGHGSHAVVEVIRQQTLALDFTAEHLNTPRAQR